MPAIRATMDAQEPTSSEQALLHLTTTVAALLDAGALEPRFAGKLARRIRREAERGERAGRLAGAVAEDGPLAQKLQALDTAVTQCRAAGLIEAMSDLRRTDAGGAR